MFEAAPNEVRTLTLLCDLKGYILSLTPTIILTTGGIKQPRHRTPVLLKPVVMKEGPVEQHLCVWTILPRRASPCTEEPHTCAECAGLRELGVNTGNGKS